MHTCFEMMVLSTDVLLIILAGIMISADVGYAAECNITGFKVNRLSRTEKKIWFNTTVDDQDDCIGRNVSLEIKQRNSSFITECNFEYTKGGYGECSNISTDGGWLEAFFNRRSISHNNCFSLLKVDHEIKSFTMDFKKDYVTFDFMNSDSRVKSWELRVYEFPNAGKCPHEPLGKQPKETWEDLGNSSQLTQHYDFDPKICYCFQVMPEAFPCGSLTKSIAFVQHSSCLPDVVNPELRVTVPKKPQNLVIILTLVTMVLLVKAVLIGIWATRKIRHPGHKDNGGESGENFLIPTCQSIMIVYAYNDPSCGTQIEELIQGLQQQAQKCKVYDIHRTLDDETIEDRIGNLRRRMRSDKILLLISPTVDKLFEELMNSNTDTCKNLNEYDYRLVFCLRNLINDDLIRNYSKVFAARFLQSGIEEEKHNSVVHWMRYSLPEHQTTLFKDMFAVAVNNGDA